MDIKFILTPNEGDTKVSRNAVTSMLKQSRVAMPHGVQVTAHKVSPKLAKALLASQYPNRPITRDNVTKLVNAIRGHYFSSQLVSIILDSEGHMITGQHLCQAIIETGITVLTLVEHGAEHVDIAHCEGTGRAQSLGNVVTRVLQVNGKQLPYITHVLRVLRAVCARGNRRYVFHGDRRVIAKALAINHPFLHPLCTYLQRNKRKHYPMRASIAAAFAYVRHHVSLEDWIGAAEVFTKGADTTADGKFEIFAQFRQQVMALGGSSRQDAEYFCFFGALEAWSIWLNQGHKTKLPEWRNVIGLDVHGNTVMTPNLKARFQRLLQEFPWPKSLRANLIP